MTRRSLPRMLFGLSAVLTPFVNPVASVLHGLAHAAEAQYAANVVATASSPTPTLGVHGGECAVEAPDHVTLHAALHRASCQDVETIAQWTALPPAPAVAASLPRATRLAVVMRRETGRPDDGLRWPARPRAPPLG